MNAMNFDNFYCMTSSYFPINWLSKRMTSRVSSSKSSMPVLLSTVCPGLCTPPSPCAAPQVSLSPSFFHKANILNLLIASLLESHATFNTAIEIVNDLEKPQTSADGSVIAPRIARTSVR